jgi:hypothetical protein
MEETMRTWIAAAVAGVVLGAAAAAESHTAPVPAVQRTIEAIETLRLEEGLLDLILPLVPARADALVAAL